MNDICNFIPSNQCNKDIEFSHFVYETNLKKFRQPLIHFNYYLNIVFKGSGTFKSGNIESLIEAGDVFFTFPGQPFEINSINNFTYLYISFNGSNAMSLLNNLNISSDNCVFRNHKDLLTFWMDSIKRINDINSAILTESVFMYTLSFIHSSPPLKKDKFETICEYINQNFSSPDMSIKKIADIFFYTEKYFSAMFIKKTGVKFTQYLNNIRIKYAIKLIKNGETEVSNISSKCGFSDQFYFSKVFKKLTGKTPSQFLKEL